LLKIIPENTTLIDFGCGEGRHLRLLEKKLSYGLGIDLNKKVLEKAIRRSKNKSNLKFQRADATDTNIHTIFDYAICMFNTIGNIKQKQRLLSEMKRLAPSPQTAIISVYSENSIEPRIAWYKNLGININEVTDTHILMDLIKSDHFTKERILGLIPQAKIEPLTEIGYLVYY
jgi:ubiquinone/menaquinone biosynthesis C-methylase UbiE